MAERGARKHRKQEEARAQHGQEEEGEILEDSAETGGDGSGYSEAESQEPSSPIPGSFGVEDQTVGPEAVSRNRRRKEPSVTVSDAGGKVLGADRKAFAMILDMLEAILVARLGPDAKLTKVERDAIEPNAAAILAKMSPKTATNIAKFSEVGMLATGVFLYSMRLASISAKREAESRGVQLNRADPARGGTATSRPAGTVAPSVVRTPPADNGYVPVGPVQRIPSTLNGTVREDVPKDGTGKVDPGLARDWGETI